jgi:rhomboid protease GluP
MIINVSIYFVDAALDHQLLLSGNLNLYDVLWNREFDRILSAMFLHADMNHLCNNMILVLFMGSVLEKATGHLAYGSIYFTSGILGNICSLCYKLGNGEVAPSIGASGAVFGMNGLLIALVIWKNANLPKMSTARVIVMVLLSLYNGFMSSNIDNAAHAGGLFAGFIMGCMFCSVQSINRNMKEKRKNG